MLLDGVLRVFDGYPYVKLASWNMTFIDVGNAEQCAYLCLDQQSFTCVAFDVDYELNECTLATSDFEVEPSDGSSSINYQFGTMPGEINIYISSDDV